MPIVQSGSINTTALVVPDLYVQIVPPQNLYLNGVPTSVLGVVGSASWGPVGTPQIVGSMAQYAQTFGPIINRKYDMGTQVATAVQQGAQDFRCVRATDGTDAYAACLIGYAAATPWVTATAYAIGALVASNGAVWQATNAATSGVDAPTVGSLSVGGTYNDNYQTPSTGVTWKLYTLGSTSVSSLAVVALYSGSLGNAIQVSLSPGSASGTWRCIIAPPGVQPEIFDNIAGAGVGSTFWTNLQSAINNGTAVRGPSQWCLASGGGAGNAGGIPVTGSTWNGTNNSTGTGSFTGMVGGTDGASTVTVAALIGVDTVPRKGMYALRGQGCSLALLADADLSTQWTTQAAFGLSEGIYMVLTGPQGDTITNAISTKATAGLDSYACKLMFGDWLWWNDQTNGVLRLVSPQGFVAGRLANLSPEQSSLNKPLYSVVASQKSGQPGSGQSLSYSSAELAALFQAGIDVISNPQPGGSYWGVRCGHNSSSNAATNGDNYTRMTNYIAATLEAGMGKYVGQLVNIDLFRRIRSTQLSFLMGMLSQGMLGTTDGSVPFSVICDISNNPTTRTALGYVQSDAQVRYQAINEKFIVNIEGGQTVTVAKQTTPAGQS